jgi:hypothetical protein
MALLYQHRERHRGELLAGPKTACGAKVMGPEMMTRLFAVSLIVLTWTTVATAAGFYVTRNGDDANPGSDAKL